VESLKSKIFGYACFAATVISVLALAFMLVTILFKGYDRLSPTLLTRIQTAFPDRAGIQLGLVGSLWLISLTTLFAVPIGIGAAIYLEEYAPKNWVHTVIQINISNLAGIPSVVYGILGLGLFVRALALDRSVLSGALTLSLVVLPIIILSAQEALRSVPSSIRDASYALGASRWQTTWHQVLPAATPSMTTGIILALSRAIGEAAPLLVVGAVGTATFLPAKLSDEFSALPVQIFIMSRDTAFHEIAGAATVVLMIFLVLMNLIAAAVRYRFSLNSAAEL